jgi:hypothetical protein
MPSKMKAHGIAIASCRHEREDDDDDVHQELQRGKAAHLSFQRFQSPAANKRSLNACRRSSFKPFQGKDGREGRVSSTELGGDWVLAESEQVAAQCTTDDKSRARLSGDLCLRNV